MDLTSTVKAAPGWPPRMSPHHIEMESGSPWAPMTVDSEYNQLRDVVLYAPGESIDAMSDPRAALFDERVTSAQLQAAFSELHAVFDSSGIRVHTIAPELVDDGRHPNVLFQRDVFWPTRFGVVVGRMASEVRAGEERYTSATLAARGVPVVLTVGRNGTFEGADCLWLRPNRVICGIGHRTNAEGLAQVADMLSGYGVRTVQVATPQGVRHLLGCVQIISPTRALIRERIASPQIVQALQAAGYEVIGLPEHPEIAERAAFNFITINPDTLVTARAPWLCTRLRSLGISVVAQVDSDPYCKAGGGLACASGVLARDPLGRTGPPAIPRPTGANAERGDHRG